MNDLDLAAIWVIVDATGKPIGRPAGSLRLALVAARDGESLCRRSGMTIEVSADQVTGLKWLIADM